MYQRDKGTCPMCGGTLPKETKSVQSVVVPDGAKEALYTGPGEVTRRGKIRAQTIRGRREIVQDIHVWHGAYKAPYAPFCQISCAARFAALAWREGVRLQSAEPPQSLTAEPEADALADRFNRLGHDTAAPVAVPAHAVVSAAAEYLAPGERGWHPPGSPPPVPGEFRYARDGKRISDTPQEWARLRATAERARTARLTKQEGGAMAPAAAKHQAPATSQAALQLVQEPVLIEWEGGFHLPEPWKALGLTERQWSQLSPRDKGRLRSRVRREAVARLHNERYEPRKPLLPPLNGQHR